VSNGLATTACHVGAKLTPPIWTIRFTFLFIVFTMTFNCVNGCERNKVLSSLVTLIERKLWITTLKKMNTVVTTTEKPMEM
jgi:hypothetical protein